MKSIKIIGVSFMRTVLVVAALLIFFGCLKNKDSDCPNDEEFTVQAEAISHSGGSQDDVKDVRLFLFDQNRLFVEEYNTQIGNKISIGDNVGESFTAVVWGNADKLAVQPIDNKGVHLYDFLLTTESAVRQRQIEQRELMPDLFFGAKSFSIDRSAPQNVVVPILRKVGAVEVKVEGVRGFVGADDSDYYISVSNAYGAIDFGGEYSGDEVSYRPKGAFGTGDNYRADEFYMPAVDKGLTVNVHHGADLVYSTSQLDDGKPIVVEAEQLLSVRIVFPAKSEGSEISITCSLKPWDSVEIEK